MGNGDVDRHHRHRQHQQQFSIIRTCTAIQSPTSLTSTDIDVAPIPEAICPRCRLMSRLHDTSLSPATQSATQSETKAERTATSHYLYIEYSLRSFLQLISIPDNRAYIAYNLGEATLKTYIFNTANLQLLSTVRNKYRPTCNNKVQATGMKYRTIENITKSYKTH